MRLLRKLTRGLSLALRVARLLWPYARGNGGRLIAGVLLSAAMLALHVAQPWPIKWVIDLLSGQGAPPAALPLLCAAYIAVTAAAAGAEYGHRVTLGILGSRIVFAFREKLFAHLLGLPLSYHDRKSVGELITRVVSDTSRLRRGVIGFLTRIGQTGLLFAATVGMLLWLDAALALIVLGCGLVAIAAMLVGNRRILSASRRSRKREGALAGIVEENLRGVRELQTFGAPPDPRFEQQSRKNAAGELKVQRLEASLLFRVETLLAVAVCLLLLHGSSRVAAGRLTAGDLVLFVTYTLALYRPFLQFARQASQSGRTAACAERLIRIMERGALVDGTCIAGNLAGDLALTGVDVRAPRRVRGGRRRVLAGVSLRVRPGERIGILGANGAGKSTLLRLVARLIDPGDGRVLVDGRDVRDYTLSSLRGQISMVCQEAVLFGLTVRQNIALGRPGATDDEVAAAARRAGAAPFIARLRRGYDTVVRGGRLFSPGERHRLALARALLRDGRLWLLDEPTTSMDAPEEVERVLLEATRGRTTLWVTHDPAVARRLDRILVLEHGGVKFLGTPAEEAACRS